LLKQSQNSYFQSVFDKALYKQDAFQTPSTIYTSFVLEEREARGKVGQISGIHIIYHNPLF
jgi:hypothetical protein